jgi:hypothetical protein
MPRVRRSVKAVNNLGLGNMTKKHKHAKRTKKNRHNKGKKLVGGGREIAEAVGRACGGQAQANAVITKQFIANAIKDKQPGILIDSNSFHIGEFGGSAYGTQFGSGKFELNNYYIIHNGNYYFIEKKDYDPTVPGYVAPATAPAPATATAAPAPATATAAPAAPAVPATAPANKIQKDVDQRMFDVYILTLTHNTTAFKGLFKLEPTMCPGAFNITDTPKLLNDDSRDIIDIDGAKRKFSGSLLKTDPTGAATAAAAPAAAAAAAAAAAPVVVPPVAPGAAARRLRTPAKTNVRQNTAADTVLTFDVILKKIKDKKESVTIANLAQIKNELKRLYTDNGNVLQSTEFDDDFVIGKLKNSTKILCYINGTEELFELKDYTNVNAIHVYILCKMTQTAANTGFDTATYTIPVDDANNIDPAFNGAIAANAADLVLNIPITDDGNGGLLYEIVPFDPAGTASAVKTQADTYNAIAP